jgi:hypothetical protein
MNKVDLNKILFTEINRLKKDFPEENWYTDEELKTVPEAKYIKYAMKEACRQALELAAENAKTRIKTITEHEDPPYSRINKAIVVDKDSIINTINQVE